jgi:hypothetical protein
VRARGFRVDTCSMDKGYDNNRVYDECAERRVAAIIPLRKGRKAPLLTIAHSTDEWRSLYRRRSAAEREFGRLKPQYGSRGSRSRSAERGPFRSRRSG